MRAIFIIASIPRNSPATSLTSRPVGESIILEESSNPTSGVSDRVIESSITYHELANQPSHSCDHVKDTSGFQERDNNIVIVSVTRPARSTRKGFHCRRLILPSSRQRRFPKNSPTA